MDWFILFTGQYWNFGNAECTLLAPQINYVGLQGYLCTYLGYTLPPTT